MSKQDRQGVRQASDLEQKYNFGKSFAEIMGIATDAQKKAKEANNSVAGLDHDAVFKLLTKDGTLQGIYREPGKDDLYINAEYIKSGVLKAEEVYSESGGFNVSIKDGVFETASEDSTNQSLVHISGNKETVDYDGYVSETLYGEIELVGIQEMSQGVTAFGSTLSPMYLTLTNDGALPKFIASLSSDAFHLQNAETWEGLHIVYDNTYGWQIQFDAADGETEWLNPPMEIGQEYRTHEMYQGKPVYAQTVNLGTLPNTETTSKTYCSSGATMVRMNGLARRTSDGLCKSLPFITDSGEIRVVLSASKDKVIVKTFSDMSGYTCTVDCYYTKD